MSRIARFIEPNGLYHIISRALNETWIFRDNTDFNHFIKLMRTAKEKYPIRLFHYVLMNTHFHMALQTYNHATLSKHIAYLKWHYTMWIRKKYNWKGPLWRERYKSLIIENEEYLYACGMYISYNPVRAGICNDPADYPYSSYQQYNDKMPNPLIDNQKDNTHAFDDCRLLEVQYALRTSLSKNIFSRASIIGSQMYIEKMAVPKSDSHF